MGYSKIDIINLALTRVGAKTITGLEDNDQAIIANIVWSFAVDELLESHDWTFAIKRAELSKLSTPATFQWAFRYGKPVDCVRVISISFEDGRELIDFDVEGDDICCNVDNTVNKVYCRYVSNDLGTANFSAKFAKALALKIATDLAVRIMQSNSLKNELFDEFNIAYREAIDLNNSQGYYQDEKGVNTWLRAGR